MSNLNYNEIGQIIRVNVGEDISAATPTLFLLPEVGDKLEITAGVSIPSVSVTVDDEVYLADEYIEYATVDEDLSYVGRWKKKAQLKYSASNISQTDYVKFQVMP